MKRFFRKRCESSDIGPRRRGRACLARAFCSLGRARRAAPALWSAGAWRNSCSALIEALLSPRCTKGAKVPSEDCELKRTNRARARQERVLPTREARLGCQPLFPLAAALHLQEKLLSM